jgi:tetratricopeptide (TPR) repeat protein
MHGDRWEEIAGYAEKIIKLDPESFPDAYLYHAIGKLTLRDFASAERSARMAMKLDPEHRFPRAEYVLGLALSAQGDLSGAQEHLAQYIESDPKAPDLEQIKERIRALEKARTTPRLNAH